MHTADDILTQHEETNDNFPLSRAQIIDAMIEYATVCETAARNILSSPDYILAPLEDLYRKEHPQPSFYIPCRHKFFKWIVSKIV